MAALAALDVAIDTVRARLLPPGPADAPGARRASGSRSTWSPPIPRLAVALDAVAAHDLAAAAGLESLPFGKPSWWGRTLLAVDGLEASLTDAARKRRVWSQFKGLRP